MPTTLTAKFDTRRDAEMAVERLVQEYAIERTDIFVSADGDANTVGTVEAGSDIEHREASAGGDTAPPLSGAIVVSVDIDDDARAAEVRSAFDEFDARDTAED